MNPFPEPWEAVTATVVEGFLKEASEEGLTWEAKGGPDAPSKKAIRKAVSGFANSRDGGCLILGADETADGGWVVSGVPLPGGETEPEKWLDSVLRAGLRPPPRVAVKSWALSEARWLMLLLMEPMAGPCLTSDGVAYERLTGRTEPIREPTVLADLYRRGEAARANAEGLARSACDLLFGFRPAERVAVEEVRIGIATAPVALPGRHWTTTFWGGLPATADRGCTRGTGHPGGRSFQRANDCS